MPWSAKELTRMKHPHDEDTQTLISKYFDEVITSSDIDPTKRPGVALE